MAQFFYDCRMSAIANRRAIALLWIRVVKDLAFSIPLEWQREVSSLKGDIDYTGLADSVMLSLVVGINALGLCWISIVFGIDPAVRHGVTDLLGVITLSLAILIGLLSAFAMIRNNSTQWPRIR